MNNRKIDKYASYPHWCISPHADHHHRPVCHTWFTTEQSVCHTVTTVQCIIYFHFNQTWRRPAAGASTPSCKISARSRKQSTRCALRIFFTFWPLGASPWAKVHQKGRWHATHPELPSCQISSPCVNPRRRYPLQKICRQTWHVGIKMYKNYSNSLSVKTVQWQMLSYVARTNVDYWGIKWLSLERWTLDIPRLSKNVVNFLHNTYKRYR